MATITQRANGYWQARVRVKGAKPLSETFSSKTKAKRWADSTETALKDGRRIPELEAKKHLLSEVIDRYIKTEIPKKRDQRAPKSKLIWWKSELGHLYLSDVTPPRISEAKDKLLAGRSRWGTLKGGNGDRSPSTVNRYLASLSAVLQTAWKEWHLIDSNPVRSVSKEPEPEGRVRYLDDGERERLLVVCEASPHPLLYPAVILALSTGARQGELMGLEWDAVDLKAGRAILTHTKNGKTRSLPLRGKALDLLKELFRNRNLGTNLVFPARKKMTKTGRADLREAWAEALEKAEIKNFRWHDLRHSCASYLAMNGASVPEIATVLGHRDFSMAARYAHLSSGHIESVVEKMNEKFIG